jgi:prepilin-type N-terminal cleavage/methylation domain-containing protein
MLVERRVTRVERQETSDESNGARCALALDPRGGFTLTELMVVLVILAILTTMTVYAVNFSLAAERSRSAARQVQSYLEGARDRAIYASSIDDTDRPVGVRFLLDPNIENDSGNLATASSMVFIENVYPLPEGEVTVSAPTIPGGNWSATRYSGEPTWNVLYNKGLLIPGVRIIITEAGFPFPYTIQSVNTTNFSVTFTPPFRSGAGRYDFKLQLPPVIRPNQEPMLLPQGIVIDLDRSQVPSYWRQGSGYINQLDIMFSRRGTVSGRAAAGGLVHFYLAEAADVERLNSVGLDGIIPSDEPYGAGEDSIGDRILVTLFPQTGAISSHPVNPTDGDLDNEADNPYYYAVTGEVAGE